MEIPAVLSRCPLFDGLEGAELEGLLDCLSARAARRAAGGFFLMAGQQARWAGVLLTGRAQVIREDFSGSRTLVAPIEPGELFAEAFACASGGGQTLTVSVRAAADSTALLLDLSRAALPCERGCPRHARLTANLLAVMADKNLLLSRRVGHLSRRSTREKVLSYLSEQAVLRGADTFTIPFDRQELADYLCVERSALSAVLSALRREGALDFHRSTFTLRAPAEED